MAPFPDRLRFGIHAGQQFTDFPAYVELWRTAEELGLDWASVFDHFMPIQADPTGPCFEGLTLLAAMAAHTERLRCGIIVVGITYRNPALLAKMAATIDHVSGGRLELGIGGAWYELEHDQYGIPFPPIGQRLAMMGEAAVILKSLWTEERTTFSGRHYQLKDAMCEPKPLQQPRIPLWIGGSGERVTLRHVAAQADGWNTFLLPMDEFEHKLQVLSAHCDDVGRDRSEIRIQLVLQAVLGADDAEAEEQLRVRAEHLGLEPQALRDRGLLAMTPERLAEHLRPYVEHGVGDFLVAARPPMDRRTLELFAGQVAPALRG
ncbi:MAG TPA: LLM class F420-dependent oxidoreductase [Solirubrobacteraceae bacterium]|jgi:F420-dependent oxidoreductase-like protein|nr:LLM class F420-dependent oxidoreductase [Solirubrobacteraceae bacterium]